MPLPSPAKRGPIGSLASLSLQTANVLGTANQQHQQAGAARAQGKYAADIATQNAGLDDERAADATSRGQQQESQFRTGVRRLEGTQRAGYAGQGVTGAGSAADVLADTSRMGALDALTIRNNAAREARGYTIQAANDRAAGQNAMMASNNQADALNAGAASTLLTGGAGLANMWQKNPPTFGKLGAWYRNRNQSADPLDNRGQEEGY